MRSGELIAQAASFEEDLLLVDPFDAPAIAAAEEDETGGGLPRTGAGHARLCAQMRIQEGRWSD